MDDSMDSGLGDAGSLLCPSVPTVYPSVDEWEDPLRYLETVRGRGELVGMVKVVVPVGWEPVRYVMIGSK